MAQLNCVLVEVEQDAWPKPDFLHFTVFCYQHFPASCTTKTATLHLFQHEALAGMRDQGDFPLSGRGSGDARSSPWAILLRHSFSLFPLEGVTRSDSERYDSPG